jgi:hypothetical protein
LICGVACDYSESYIIPRSACLFSDFNNIIELENTGADRGVHRINQYVHRKIIHCISFTYVERDVKLLRESLIDNISFVRAEILKLALHRREKVVLS